jgi:Flp pilus assembly protein TadD
MKKIIYILLISSILLAAMDIDYKTLEEIVSNDSHALKERIILAKYYEKNGNDLKAMNLLDEVLSQDVENKDALKIKKIIKTKKRVKNIFREAGLQSPVSKQEAEQRLDTYYAANNYQFYSNLYQALVDTNTSLEDAYHIKAAYIYLWDANYAQSTEALDRLKQENNLDEAKIRADICYYTGKYRCSVKMYEKLYDSTYDISTAMKLINSYIYLGEIGKAQRLHSYIYRKYPNNKELKQLDVKLTNLKEKSLIDVQKEYEINPNILTLKKYVNVLYGANKKEETLALLSQYNEKKQTRESLLLEAKYLVWEGKSQEALRILNLDSLQNDLEAKLMLGQIYSWNENYKDAKEQLQYVLKNTKNIQQHFDAQNILAHIYMWEKNEKKAKEIFESLQKEQPKNKEVKEALMQLNHDYNGLVKIYESKVTRTKSLSDIKYLAELYTLTNQKQKAISTLESYLEQNPYDLEATKALGLLLVNQKNYYKGFGYLEYYAAQKQTSASQILLARNYYWHGFSKEALDILDKVITKERKNKPKDISLVEKIDDNSDLEEALKLKAEILKIAPRFTTSNSGATIKSYYEDLGKKQLFLADTLYFNSHYKASLNYYKNYLRNHPNDHEVRYRYAFALENAQQYGEAEGEFSLLFWTKDSDELRYHYAYNMMKNGKSEESKKLLTQLKANTYQALDKNMSNFLTSWKDSWESLDYKKYSAFYSTKFREDERWAYKKQAIFANVNYISVGIYDAISKKIAENKYEIKFYQEYSTNKKSDKGYKTLEIECDSQKIECRITKESWKKGAYKKHLLLTPYIDKSLKENEYLKTHPISLRSKKKNLLQNEQNITIYT